MAHNNSFENVLILQGGCSLGAFGSGVFKALAETRVKIDILAGKSIGGINTAIIAGSKSTLQGKSGFLIYMRIQTLHRQE